MWLKELYEKEGDILIDLLDNVFSFTFNANDIFLQAADSEDVDVDDLPILLDLYKKYKYDGLNAFMAHQRGYEVLGKNQTKQYKQAKKELVNLIKEKA